MKKLIVCGVFAALIAAAPAEAAKLKPCGRGNLPQVQKVFHAGIGCIDSLVLIRAVEASDQQCDPYKEGTIAPYRECVVTPNLSVGTRNFFCRSAYEDTSDAKRWWRTTCKSFSGDVVKYRRDGNHVG